MADTTPIPQDGAETATKSNEMIVMEAVLMQGMVLDIVQKQKVEMEGGVYEGRPGSMMPF